MGLSQEFVLQVVNQITGWFVVLAEGVQSLFGSRGKQ